MKCKEYGDFLGNAAPTFTKQHHRLIIVILIVTNVLKIAKIPITLSVKSKDVGTCSTM